jgi:hypothetical protein
MERPLTGANAMADMDRKPLPKLSNDMQEEIINAIVGSYDVSDLSQVLRFKWGFVLRDYIDTRQGFHYVVTDLVDWTERKGKTRELLAVAYSQAPGNQKLQSVAAKCGLSLQWVSQKYGADGSVTKPASLEALVNKHSRLIDYVLFMQRLRDMGQRICLVQTPYTRGTGFLIGPDRALTNFHVVEHVIANKTPATEIVCRFDYQSHEGDASLIEPRSYKLAPDGILAYSPYSDSDLSGDSETEPNKLDYAVLRLAEPVASKPAVKPRGWFKLTVDSSAIALRDFIIIPQHAEAQPLRIAWGSIVAFPGAGHRIRYDATTEKGSSGSPVFNADLDLVGLHHAAEAQYNPAYNQAVPLWLVARDLATKGITPSY